MTGAAVGPVLVVAGARPNFMKVAPVLAELARRDQPRAFVHTGQHFDTEMSGLILAELGVPAPDRHLGVGGGSHAVQTARIMTAFEPVLDDLDPSWVVVVGDVDSSLACALVAAKRRVRVAHVEAGLRSGDWAMPEEINRVVIDRLSDLLLVPSPDGVDNLAAEGLTGLGVRLVGNVMVDSLMAGRVRARDSTVLDRVEVEAGKYAVLTLHRPSNVDDDATFASVLSGLADLAATMPVVYPVHPRVRAAVARVGVPAGVRAVEPLGYLDFTALQESAALVLTDSGGIQEETTVLGVPCLTLRTTTERPITVTEGTNRLVGVDPVAIAAAVAEVLADPPAPRRPALWDGRAAPRIVDALGL